MPGRLISNSKAGDLPQYCKDDPKTTVPVVVIANRLTFINVSTRILEPILIDQSHGKGGIGLMYPQTANMTKIGCSTKVEDGFGMFDVLTPNAKGGTDTFAVSNAWRSVTVQMLMIPLSASSAVCQIATRPSRSWRPSIRASTSG